MTAYDCNHDEFELRERTFSNGTIHYTFQCLRCGAALRTVKHSSNEVAQAKLAGNIPPFDETLRDIFYQQARQVYQEAREQGSAEWWKWYAEYLNSPEWQEKREKVLARDKELCQGCGKRRATHVHHLDYSHVGGDEFLFELISLCDFCHKRIHEDSQDEPTNVRIRAAISR